MSSSPPDRALRLPAIPGPLEALVLAWRRLRRMSTALVLLGLLALASIVATFVPQEPVIAPTVRQWRDGSAGPGEAVAAVFDWLGWFDVFGSWWFTVITVLLFTSLTACLIPRWKAFLRVARQAPRSRGSLATLPHQAELRSDLEPDAALARAKRSLRTYRTRRLTTAAGAAQLAVARGHWREGGSLAFHTSFYLLLIGVILGSAFSFTGHIDVVEGEAFADTPIVYDLAIPGRFYGPEDHPGFTTRLDDFTVAYAADGFTPAEYRSDVTILEDGREVTAGPVRVNHPLHHDGLTLYQRAFGFAPHLVIRPTLDDDPGEAAALFDKPVILRPEGALWQGREKVAAGNPERGFPQIAVDLTFVTDARYGGDGSVIVESPEPNDPRLVLSLYAAPDLGLSRPVPLSQLAWREDQLVDLVMLTPGQTVSLLGGALEVEFAGLPMWSGFQVSHQPFRWLLLTAASLALSGLIPSLYSYRRRLWITASPDPRGGTALRIAGLAQQRPSRFAEEFDALVERLQARGVGRLPRSPALPDRTPERETERVP